MMATTETMALGPLLVLWDGGTMSAGQRTRRMNQPTAGKEALPGRGGVCYRRKARPIRRCSRSSCRTAASWRCTGCPHRGTGLEDRWLQDEIRTVRRPAAWTTWGAMLPSATRGQQVTQMLW